MVALPSEDVIADALLVRASPWSTSSASIVGSSKAAPTTAGAARAPGPAAGQEHCGLASPGSGTSPVRRAPG